MKSGAARPRQREGENDNRGDRCNFNDCEDDLHASPDAYAEIVDERQRHERDNGEWLGPSENEYVRFMKERRGNMPRKNRRCDCWHQESAKAKKSRGNRRHRGGPPPNGMHPPEQEAPNGPKAPPKITIFAACLGDCRA